jgi:hypothetical protein
MMILVVQVAVIKMTDEGQLAAALAASMEDVQAAPEPAGTPTESGTVSHALVLEEAREAAGETEEDGQCDQEEGEWMEEEEA